jgi:hypothetical protein
MDQASRSERLGRLAVQAKGLLHLAKPVTAHLLRVLDALTPEDIEELGKWELDKPKTETIVDRLTAELAEHRQVVLEVLGRCLRLDVWGANPKRYASLEQTYRQSGAKDSIIEKQLGRPPKVYPFVSHFVVGLWTPGHENGLTSLIIEDDRWGAICEGYLVAKGLAFPTTLDLMECAIRQQWSKWDVLWTWF